MSSPQEMLRSPTPPASASLPTAVVFGLLGGLAISVFLVICDTAIALGQGADLSVPHLAFAGGVLFLAFAPLLFLASWWYHSRRVQDTGFRWIGLFATFFGLAVLFYFFVNLGSDVTLWFQATPRLIEAKNQALVEKVKVEEAKQQNLEGLIASVIDLGNKAIDRETDPREIAKIKKQTDRAVKRAKIESEAVNPTLNEKRNERDRGLRPDTTPLAILVHFLTKPNEGDVQDVGIMPAFLGSLWLGFITLVFAVPVGVGAAIYLEEYRTSSGLSRVIQVNINNLAGVPAIVYGILGSFVFVGLIFMPLSQWNDQLFRARNLIAGGLTLGLMTLPVIIVSAQEALRAVPQSIRSGAYALGATHWQTIRSLVLPMATPGIMTGTILAVSRAIGEAAPLVVIGASQSVTEAPNPLSSAFTALPVQIYQWASQPPVPVPGMPPGVHVWHGTTGMAIVLLLILLLGLNAMAIYLRNSSQKTLRG